MTEFRVEGVEQFYELSKALKRAGKTDVRKALAKGMKDGVKPLVPLIREAARQKLPSRGGLANRMARRPITPVVRTGADPGIGLVMRKTQPGYITGVIRHPTFKPLGPVKVPWVTQQVDGDWFDQTIADNLDVVLPALEKNLQKVIDEIVEEITP